MLSGHFVISPDHVLLIGKGLVTKPHRHLNGSLTFSLDEPFTVRAGKSSEPKRARMLAMRPDTLNAVDASHARIVNLQLDPETEAYARLKSALLRDQSLVMAEEYGAEQIARIRASVEETPLSGERIARTILDVVGAPQSGKVLFDRRISQTLSLLKTSFPEAPSSGELAERVGLSESRLMHLFREQVGVPLRRYTLWLRVRHVFFCIATGQNLTDAAHEAGFSDSSHLSRVFADMFGLTASQLVRSEHMARSFELPQMPLRGPHAEQDAARIEKVLRSQPEMLKLLAAARSPANR